MSEHDVESLRRIYQAVSRWDVEELVSDLAHDIEWSLPDTLPWGGTRHGHEGVRAFASVSQDHIDGRWADPDDFLDAGDRLVVLGRMRGRARASGRDYEVEFVHVWTMTDGVASRLRAYFDTAPIMAALGDGTRLQRRPPLPQGRLPHFSTTSRSSSTATIRITRGTPPGGALAEDDLLAVLELPRAARGIGPIRGADPRLGEGAVRLQLEGGPAA